MGNKFKDRNEVMTEIARILGPGCDISVEVDDPFADFSKTLKRPSISVKLFSDYRVVMKVPHTGPVNGANANELIQR